MSSLRRTLAQLQSRGLSCKSESTERIHDKVDPQKLNSLQGGFFGDYRANEGDDQGAHVNSQLELEETLDVVIHIATPHSSFNDRGEVVISDRYFDSSAAYQGAGRVLNPTEVARISRWATESLYPTLTILIDLPAEIGLGRLQSRDRLEAESNDFHERVRQEYLQIAMMDPERYFVVDGTQSVEEINAQITTRVAELPALKRNATQETKRKFRK